MTWALTTVISLDPKDQYREGIRPITEPIFKDYCERWGLDYRPCEIHPDETAWQAGTIAHALGTAVVYASIPNRRALLEQYEGIIYIDLDAVILQPWRDIREMVELERPVALPDTMSSNVQILLSCDFTKELLDECWAERTAWSHLQWTEEGYFKAKFGWDWDYTHGDPSLFVARTDCTDKVLPCQFLSNHYTDRRVDSSWAMNPGGTHPFSARQAKVREYAKTQA